MRTKLCIFNSNVKSILLYGCETWRTTQTLPQKTKKKKKIQTFFNTCLMHFCKIRWQEKIPNEDLWEGAGQEQVAKQNIAEEVGLDRTHPQEASIQHHTSSPDLEPAGEAEERPASQQLEARH